jgi:hypothetical protein
MNDVMTPYTTAVTKVTPVTLAVFEDSGWYRANFSAASAFVRGKDFAYKQGCEFALGRCLRSQGNDSSGTLSSTGSPPQFCTEHGSHCTPDRTGVGYCAVGTLQQSISNPLFNYFGNANLGSTSYENADYCPMILAYSNAICTDTT